ncbi:MAG TPA: hypothetical protein VFV55_02000 [Usitatibacteraceae bacterium]|nr:hypothetical protein [Usitatibacteraceae bacterium]
MPHRLILLLLLACLPLVGTAYAQEQASTNRATDLKERPAPDSRTLAPLAADSPVKVLSRQGGWTQVESGAQRGWVRAFHLRFQSTVETAPSGNALGGLTSMFGFGSRKAPETSRVATLGIRGLTPEDFKNASPDLAALKKLQSWRVDKASAERFAKEAKLVPVAVAYQREGGGS